MFLEPLPAPRPQKNKNLSDTIAHHLTQHQPTAAIQTLKSTPHPTDDMYHLVFNYLLLRSSTTPSDHRQAEKMYSEIHDPLIQLHREHYQALFNTYLRTHRLGDAFRVYHHMRFSGFRPSLEDYSVLVKERLKHGNWAGALKLYADTQTDFLKEGGGSVAMVVQPLVEYGIQHGHVHESMDMMQSEMEHLDLNRVVSLCLETGLLDEALFVWHDCCRRWDAADLKTFPLDAETLNVLVRALSREKRWRLVLDVERMMSRLGMSVDWSNRFHAAFFPRKVLSNDT